jgi:DNA-binding MarR family transcriptional regulator
MRAKRIARVGDAKDGRITRLSLTRQGTAIYDEIVPLALHLEQLFLAALTPAERTMLAALMDKLAAQVNGLHISAVR